MPGGKGVNVARVLKTLGAPVIATGLAGGATGTRIVEQLTQLSVLQRLRAHPRGVAHQHRGDRPDDRRADRDQRARPAGHRRTRSSCSSDKLLYLAKGASMCVFAGSLPRDVDVDIYARLIRELRRLGVDDRGRHRRRPAAPRRARRAGRDLAERARGRGARRPRVQRRRGPRRSPCARWCELGAREAIMTMPDGCFARCRSRTARRRALPRRGARPRRAARDRRLRRRLPGRLRRRPLPRPRAGRLPAYGVACGAESTQHLGAGLVDPRARRAAARRDRGRAAGAPAEVG